MPKKKHPKWFRFQFRSKKLTTPVLKEPAQSHDNFFLDLHKNLNQNQYSTKTNVEKKKRFKVISLKKVDHPCPKWADTRYARGITIDFRSLNMHLHDNGPKVKIFRLSLTAPGRLLRLRKQKNVKRFLEFESGPNTFTFALDGFVKFFSKVRLG